MGPASEVPPANRTRILIADDDRFFAELLRSALAAHDDFEVVAIVENGAEAVSGSESLKPTLVLMDVTMPVLDGIAATRKLRELKDPPTVVLITGEESEANGRRAYEAGAAAYLRKSQELVAVIDVVIAVSQLSAAPAA
jgi:DNA-binding NarL/FixJ family response regulator